MKRLMIVTLIALSFTFISARELRTWFTMGHGTNWIAGDYVDFINDDNDVFRGVKIEHFCGLEFAFNMNTHHPNNFFWGMTYKYSERGWVYEEHNYLHKTVKNNYSELYLKFGYALQVDVLEFAPFVGIGMSSPMNSNANRVRNMNIDFPVTMGIDVFANRLVVGFGFNLGTQNVLEDGYFIVDGAKYRSYNTNIGYRF